MMIIERAIEVNRPYLIGWWGSGLGGRPSAQLKNDAAARLRYLFRKHQLPLKVVGMSRCGVRTSRRDAPTLSMRHAFSIEAHLIG
jgi:hypothetical protein